MAWFLQLLPQTLEASVAELTTALLQFLIKETQTLLIQKAAPVLRVFPTAHEHESFLFAFSILPKRTSGFAAASLVCF